MRVAVIVVAVLVVTTPSEASKSCMTKAEARQQFGSVHLYWHGPKNAGTPRRAGDTRPTGFSEKLPSVRSSQELIRPNGAI